MVQPPVSLDASVRAEVGKESVDKLVDAVLDAFSPATESLGLLGDAVRLARVGVATAITRQAKAIADQNRLLLKLPPLKFLVPFYERCSLEDEESDLKAAWARLLVSAGSDYDPVLATYVDVLSRIGSEEVVALKEMCSHWNVDTESFRAFQAMMEYREVFASIITNPRALKIKQRSSKTRSWNTPGSLAAGYSVPSCCGGGGGTVYHTNAYRGRERHYDVLERERLILVDEIESSPPLTQQYFAGIIRPKIFVAQPTAIGFDLIRRCQ